MEKRVFSQKAFLAEAKKDFVLLTLDYQEGLELSAETTQRRKELYKRYGNPPMPTIFFTDEKGRPFMTGKSSVKMDEWLGLLSGAVSLRKQLQGFQSTADSLDGQETVVSLVGKAELLGLERVHSFYPELVELIKKNDADDQSGYSAKFSAFESYLKLTESVDQMFEDGKLDQMKKSIDELVKNPALETEKKQSLLEIKANVLYEEGDFKLVKATIEQAIALNPNSKQAKKLQELLAELE